MTLAANPAQMFGVFVTRSFHPCSNPRMQPVPPASTKAGSMKLPYHLNHLGTCAAIFLFIVPGNPSWAKDRQAPSRPAGTPAAVSSGRATCSADGQFYAVAAPHGRVHYGRSQDGVILRTFYECQPQALEFSPDGRLLAIAGDFNGRPPRVKIWQVSDGALLCRIETGLRNRLLVFSPDNLLLAVGDGSRLGLWALPKGRMKWLRTTQARISQLSFASDGQAVDAINADGSIQQFRR